VSAPAADTPATDLSATSEKLELTGKATSAYEVDDGTGNSNGDAADGKAGNGKYLNSSPRAAPFGEATSKSRNANSPNPSLKKMFSPPADASSATTVASHGNSKDTPSYATRRGQAEAVSCTPGRALTCNPQSIFSLERPDRAIDWRVEWLKRPKTET